MTQKPIKPVTKRLIAIQCWSCEYWNVPKIDENNKIVYSSACANRDCRLTTYMKTELQVILEKKERAKQLQQFNPNHMSKRLTYHGKVLLSIKQQ